MSVLIRRAAETGPLSRRSIAVAAAVALTLAGLAAPLVHAADAAAATPSGLVVPVTSSRVFDSGASSPIKAGSTTAVPVAGRSGVPATGASAVTVSVTASASGAAGSLTVFPYGSARPATPNVWFAKGQSATNTVTVKLGSGGKIAIANVSSGGVRVQVDVQSYVTAGTAPVAGGVVPLTSARVFDSGPSAPVKSGTTTAAVVGAHGGVPGTAVAVVLDVTAQNATGPGAVTVYPYGAARPATPNVYFAKGQTVAEAVTVRLGSAGRVAIYNGASGTIRVTADVQAYITAGTAAPNGGVVPLTSARVYDSATTGSKAPVGSGANATVAVAGHAGVPVSGVSAVTVQVTASAGTAAGAATVYPYGAARPATPNLYFAKGQTVVDAVSVRLGTGGRLAVYNAAKGTVRLQVDVQSYVRGPANTPPGPVTDLDATPSATSVQLSWTNPSDSDFAGVVIRRATGSTPPASVTDGTSVTTTGASATTYTDTSLSSGSTYSYALFAIDSTGNVAPSATVTTTTTQPADTTPPGPVTDLDATPSATSVHLSWTNPSDSDFAGVVIRRAAGSTPPASVTDGTSVTTTDASATTYTDTSLSSGSTYSYALFAVDTSGNDASGATVTTTTTTPADTTPPGPVTGVTSAPGTTSVQLSWTNPSDSDFAGVVIRRAAGSTPPGSVTDGTPVTTTGASATTYTDTNLSSGSTYSYALFAIDSTGNVAPSATVTTTTTQPADTTPPGPVTNAASSASTTSVQLSWTNPADGDFAGVIIRRAVGSVAPAAPSAGDPVTTTSSAATQFVDSGLAAATTYSYALFAIDTSGNAARAATTKATTRTPVPGTCTTSFTGATSSSWEDGTNWSAGAVPGAADQVCIPATASNLPAVIGAPETVSTLTDNGDLTIQSTLHLTGSTSTSAGHLSVAGGALAVDGVLSVSGALDLNGALTGQGRVSETSDGTMTVTNYASLQSGTLTLGGASTVAANAYVGVYATATLTNSGPLSLAAGANITTYCGSPSSNTTTGVSAATAHGQFTNSGAVTVGATTANPATIGGCGFSDTGSVTVGAGQLDVGGQPLYVDAVDDTTHVQDVADFAAGSTLTVAKAAALSVTSQTTLEHGAAGSLSGPVTVAGTFDLEQDTTFTDVTVNGTLTGAAAVTVTHALTLAGQLAGTGTTTVPAGATATLSYGGVTAGHLVNAGTATVPSTQGFSVSAGAEFDNSGSLTMSAGSQAYTYCGAASYSSGGNVIPAVAAGVFRNTGSITVSATNAYPASISGCGFDDQGTVAVTSGQLNLGGQTLQLDPTDGTTVVGSPATLDSGAHLSVASAASLTVVGTVTVSSGASLAAAGPVTVNSVLELDQDTTLPSLTVNYMLTGSGNVAVSSLLALNGQLATAGTVTVAKAASLTAANATLASGRLICNGSASIGGDTVLTVAASASFTSAGTLSLQSGSGLYTNHGVETTDSPTSYSAAIPAGVAVNSGTITVAATNSDPATIGGNGFDNRGTVAVSAGQLRLGGAPDSLDPVDGTTVLQAQAVTDAGATVSVTSGASLDVIGDTHFVAGSTLSAAGPVTSDSTLTLDQPTTLPTLTVNGTLAGTGAVQISKTFLMNPSGNSGYGTLAGPQTVTALAGSKTTLGSGSNYGAQVSGGSLVLKGTAALAAQSNLSVNRGASLTNAGTLTMATSTAITTSCGTTSQSTPNGVTPAVPAGVAVNSGTITVAASPSYPATIGGCGFDDRGAISVSTGRLNLGGQPSLLDPTDATTVIDAPVTVDNGATLSVTSSTSLDVVSATTVATGGTLSAAGPVTLDGALTLNQQTSLPTVTVNGSGSLGGTGNVTVTKALALGANYNYPYTATLNGPSTVTIASSATLTIGSTQQNYTAGAAVYGGSLVINGSASVVSTSSLTVGQGASVTNAGTLSLSTASSISTNAGTAAYNTPSGVTPAIGAGTFVNTGTISVAASTAFPASVTGAGFDDRGSVSVTAGQLRLGGQPRSVDAIDGHTVLSDQAVVESGATVSVASAASLDVVGNTLVVAGGTLAASGQLLVDGPLSLNQAITLPTVTVGGGGTLGGTAAVQVSKSLQLTGQNYPYSSSIAGPGTVTVASAATLTIGSGPGYGGAAVTGGTLVNNGSGSVGSTASLTVTTGATFLNAGTLTLNTGSQLSTSCGSQSQNTTSGLTPAVPAGRFVDSGSITVAASSAFPVSMTGCGLDVTGSLAVSSGSLNLGGQDRRVDTDGSTVLQMPATVDSGGSLSVASAASLNVTGSTTIASGGSLSAPGAVTVSNAELMLNQNVSLSSLTVSGATLELAAGRSATVTALTFNPSSSLQLDGDGPGRFGFVNTPGQVDVSNVYVSLNTGSYTPGCGTAISAVRGRSVTGTLGYFSGPAPSEGTWQRSQTASSAGGFLYCPPPPAPAYQSYGGAGGADGANPSGYFAEPVNTGSGAYTTQMTDFDVPGAGVQLDMTRSYTSNDPYSGPMGQGWTYSLNTHASVDGGGTVSVYAGDGQVTTYARNSDGSYTPAVGVHSTLTALSGGGWLLVRADQEHLSFDSSGRLLAWTNRDDAGLTLTYGSSGQLTKVVDFAGRSATLTYSSAGLLTGIAFPGRRTVAYGYNSANQLVSVTDARGGTTAYTYDGSGRLATVTDADGHQVVANTYDGNGRVTSQVNARGKTTTFAWDPNSQTCAITDPNGGTWQDVYSGSVLVQRIDPLGDTTSYTYDSDLNRTAVTDGNGNTTTSSYDSAGNLLTRTAPAPISTTETWTYDAFNDVTGYTSARGKKTTYTYDAAGNPTGETRPDGSVTSQTDDPSTGLPTSTTDARGSKTSYAYALGQLTSVTDPLGNTTSFGYDSAGRRTTVTDPAGKVATTAFDALDRVVSTTDADGRTTSTTYDAVGNRTAVTDAAGHTTSYVYDPDNDLTTVTAPDGSTTTCTYDANANRTSRTNPDGNVTKYSYDAANRLTGTTDPLGRTTSYGYDADGDQTATTAATGAVTSRVYDVLDRPTTVSYSDGTHAVNYTYDADGNRSSMSDGTGTTSYSYDDDGRLSSVAGPQGTFTYTYDATDDVLSRTSPNGGATYTYDRDGRPTSLTVDGSTTTYSYDADSRLVRSVLPNGVTETRSWDAASQLTGVTATAGSNAVDSYAYSYDQAGNPTTVSVNGESDSYTYDSRSRLTKVCYAASCANGSISWTYDGDGNRTAETRTGAAVGGNGAASTSYTYDAADEMTRSVAGPVTTTYGYDKAGRRTSAGTTNYSYNAADQLTATSVGQSSTTYTYNGDGLRASTTSGSATTTFAYDVNGPVAQLAGETTGANTRHYVWAAGQLQVAAVGATDYYPTHDALGSLVALTDPTGAVVRSTVYEPYGLVHTGTATSGAPTLALGWEGEYRDSSGLFQMQARYLDPSAGVFTAVDPLPAPDADVTPSPYLYADDMPTTAVDPTGRSTIAGVSGIDCSGAYATFCGVSRGYSDGISGARSAAGGDSPTRSALEESEGLGAGDAFSEASRTYGRVSSGYSIYSNAMTIYGLFQTADRVKSDIRGSGGCGW